MGKNGSFQRAMLKILQKIKNKKNRRARFICSLSIKLSKNKLITSVGIINGKISFKMKGKKGFGYDLFLYLISLNKPLVR